VPSGYRYYVKKYFEQQIKPSETSETSEEK
jgi:hypothetical protein